MINSDLDGVDFIDFGSSGGGSLRWAQDTFGKTGLGIDMDPQKIAKGRAAGYKVMEADATQLALPDNAVEFAIVSDFLEHLGTVENARKVVENAVRVARDFVYIAIPDFDNEPKLRALGCKRYYADWSGHNLPLQSGELMKIAEDCKQPYHLLKFGEMFDSFDRSILPMSAPRNQMFYDPALHEAKAFQVFPRKMFYSRVICLILKNDRYHFEDLLMKIFFSIGYLRDVPATLARKAAAQPAVAPPQAEQAQPQEAETPA